MLSAEHRAIVKATVPLLESGGEALTTHFYKTMLSEYPSVRPLFNHTLFPYTNGPHFIGLVSSVISSARFAMTTPTKLT